MPQNMTNGQINQMDCNMCMPQTGTNGMNGQMSQMNVVAMPQNMTNGQINQMYYNTGMPQTGMNGMNGQMSQMNVVAVPQNMTNGALMSSGSQGIMQGGVAPRGNTYNNKVTNNPMGTVRMNGNVMGNGITAPNMPYANQTFSQINTQPGCTLQLSCSPGIGTGTPELCNSTGINSVQANVNELRREVEALNCENWNPVIVSNLRNRIKATLSNCNEGRVLLNMINAKAAKCIEYIVPTQEYFDSLNKDEDEDDSSVSTKRYPVAATTATTQMIGMNMPEAKIPKTEDFKKPLWQMNIEVPKLDDYIYQSTKSSEYKVDFAAIRRVYPQTVVKVEEKDALSCAGDIIKASKDRVCVLAMANPTTPGGTYMKGAFGQEESIIISSTLRCGLDDNKYPLYVFDSIYTQGVVVFRKGAECGFEFTKPEDRFKIDVISFPGLNLTELKEEYNNVTKQMVKMRIARPMGPQDINIVRLKIRSILMSCIQHGATTLVLGAIGCGIFKNDPEIVARIFREEITIFAGYFHTIHFAVLGNNCGIFRKVLMKRKAMSPNEYEPRVCAPKVKWFRNFCQPSLNNLKYCVSGSSCMIWDEEHMREFEHPPLCPYKDKCRDTSEVHRLCFTHPKKCPNGGACELYYLDDSGMHREYFTHPSECSENDTCMVTSEFHLRDTLHKPCCKDCVRCPLYTTMCDKTFANDAAKAECEEHCKKYRHLDIKQRCPEGTRCRMFHDRSHWESYSHPFVKPCDMVPLGCLKMDDDMHCQNFSHLCREGPECPRINNEEHCKHWIHAFKVCPRDKECTNFSDEHLVHYMHTGQKVLRKPCENVLCEDTSREHRLQFRHMPHDFGRSAVRMHNVRDSCMETNSKWNNYSSWFNQPHVNFYDNTTMWLEKLENYMYGKVPTGYFESERFQEIVRWFRQLRPVHMCQGSVFASILNLGAMNSLQNLTSLWLRSEMLLETVLQNTKVAALTKGSDGTEQIKKYCMLLIKMRRIQMSHEAFERLKKDLAELEKKIRMAGAGEDLDALHQEKSGKEYTIAVLRKLAEKEFSKGSNLSSARSALEKKVVDVAYLDAVVNNILDGVLNIMTNIPGIGYDLDRKVRANYTVFGVFGPNNHDYGNTECTLIFRPTIMHHPDSYFTQCAATFYTNKKYRWIQNVNSTHLKNAFFDRREWMGPTEQPVEWPADGQEHAAPLDARKVFLSEKYHVADERWYVAAAKEFVCRTAHFININKKANNEAIEPLRCGPVRLDEVTLEDIITLWMYNNSHCELECHMPGTFPLDYIEHIVIQRKALEEVRANESANAALELLCKDHGADFLEVVDTPEEVRVRNKEYITAHDPDPYKELRGFSFVVSGTDETFMPLEINEAATRAYVYFSVKHGKFAVQLNEIGDCYDDNNNSEINLIEFTFNEAAKMVTAKTISRKRSTAAVATGSAEYPSSPCSDMPSPEVPEPLESPFSKVAPDFNVGCPTEQYVNYKIAIDYETNKVTLSHWGSSTVYNSKKLVVEMTPGKRYRYIALELESTDSYTEPFTRIRNLEVRYDEKGEDF